MKKTNFYAIFVMVAVLMNIVGCRTYQSAMPTISYDPIPNLLPNMKSAWFVEGNINGGDPDIVKEMILTDLSKNVINKESGKSLGEIDVVCESFKSRKIVIPLYPFYIFGVPFFVCKNELTVRFDIKDINGTIVESYWYKNKTRTHKGLYYGYGKNTSLAMVDCIKGIISRFHQDLNNNAKPIIVKLKSAVEVQAMPATRTIVVPQPTAPVIDYINSVEIVKSFSVISVSSVLTSYNNEFRKFNMPDRDEPFPYALIRVYLQGDGKLVRLAKQKLMLDLGQFYKTEETITSYDNMILFLVSTGVRNINITCGDGCEGQLIYSGRLEANKVYDGTLQLK